MGIIMADWGRMMCIVQFCMQRNVLGEYNNNVLTPFSVHQIAQKMPWIPERTLYHTMRHMEQYNIIKQVDHVWYVNPIYFLSNGMRISEKWLTLFGDDLRKIVPSWAMQELLTRKEEKDRQ